MSTRDFTFFALGAIAGLAAFTLVQALVWTQ